MANLEELKKRIKEIEQSAPADCSTHTTAFSRIIRLCSYKERSSYDMRQRLIEEGFTEAEVDEAIHQAVNLRFIDDQRFAEALIRTRINSLKGIAGCDAELRKHGINPDDVEYLQEVRCSYDRNSEVDRALSVLNRTSIHAKNVRDAAYRKLINRGFGSDVAASAARIYSENR